MTYIITYQLYGNAGIEAPVRCRTESGLAGWIKENARRCISITIEVRRD